ncbi:MAG: MIP/aquaporin family protein [Candidatus Baltobacteraceae bacterium]
MPSKQLVRPFVAEFVGTALLLVAVVGSGIMAQRLFAGDLGLELLANSIATGGALVAIILAFGPISGAHLNPAVSLCDAAVGGISWTRVPGYVAAQVAGAITGTAVANRMFDLPMFFASHHARHGSSLLFSEFVATFGLLAVIWGSVRFSPTVVPFAIAAYIVGAYWFTSSTSFANPAVTIGRAMTDTFAGIAPSDIFGFIVAQMLGAGAATALFAWLAPVSRGAAEKIIIAHPSVNQT